MGKIFRKNLTSNGRIYSTIELYIDKTAIFEENEQCARLVTHFQNGDTKEMWAMPIYHTNSGCADFEDYENYLLENGWELSK